VLYSGRRNLSNVNYAYREIVNINTKLLVYFKYTCYRRQDLLKASFLCYPH
jgi:hypothetical protein